MAHIPHVYVPGPWRGESLSLDSSASIHLRRALRRSDGDPLTYTDGTGVVGEGRLEGDLVVRGTERTVARPSRPVIAVAAPSNKDRARFLVEKLAELGTLELWWIRTRFGEGRPPSADKARAWSRSALEQSQSAWLMHVGEDPVDIASLPEPTVFADTAGSTTVDLGSAACVAIGPEGGWSDEEVPAAAPRVSLGPAILRVETAAIAVAVLGNAHHPWNPDHSQW